jgi:Ca2+-transporting ATPase
LKATGLSAVAILFGAELGILQRILGTVSLTGKQWIVCILAALTIVVASEIQKAVRRRRTGKETEEKEEVAGALALGPTTP